MEVPQIKVSQPLVIGLAVGAAVLAIVLFYENQRMRKDLMQFVGGGPRKPCGCKESINDVARESARMVVPSGVHESVVTGRLNTNPMPVQHFDDPDHPPEVVL